MGIRALFQLAEILAAVRREEPGGGGTFIAIVFQQERVARISNAPRQKLMTLSLCDVAVENSRGLKGESRLPVTDQRVRRPTVWRSVISECSSGRGSDSTGMHEC
jgi:hypothetical protein